MTIETDRRIAVEHTRPDFSRQLLNAFPELVADIGPDPLHPALYYQDCELGGALCAPAIEAEILRMAVRLLQPAVALEVGSYVGWTAAHIAAGLGDRGLLVCLDTLTECKDADACERRFWGNLQRAGLARRVRLVRGKSPDDLPTVVTYPLHFAFLDGEHMGAAPLKDVQGLESLMALHGVIALHDTWMKGVAGAVTWLQGQRWTVQVFDTPARLAFAYIAKPRNWHVFEAEVNELLRDHNNT